MAHLILCYWSSCARVVFLANPSPTGRPLFLARLRAPCRCTTGWQQHVVAILVPFSGLLPSLLTAGSSNGCHIDRWNCTSSRPSSSCQVSRVLSNPEIRLARTPS